MSTLLDIAVADPGWDAAVPDSHALARAAVEAAIAESDTSAGPFEISLMLGDDAMLRKLNRQYRGKDSPTNVLSFAAAELNTPPGIPRFLGDIAIARETATREAAESGKNLEAHLQHLIVHGVLHLLGYDHVSDAEAEDMESREVAALGRLGLPDPYRDSIVPPV